MHLATDPELAALASSAGTAVVPADSAERLRTVEAALVGGTDAWDRVRTWRGAGVRVGVVVHWAGELPPDRAFLEPLVVLRQLTPAALGVALSRLVGARGAAGVRIVGG